MRRFIPPAVVCMLVLVASGVPPVVHAGLLSPSQASTLIQSTASDTDALLLSLFYGFEAGQTINYSSSLTPTSWSGTLSGTYTGMGLSLSYLGDLSNYPSGPVTWTSSGSYGNQVWSGDGSATIGDTSSSTFLVGLSYAMTVGSHSASIVYQIPGTVRPSGAIMFGAPGDREAGSGMLNLDGANHPDSMKFSFCESPDMSYISDLGISDDNWYNAGVGSRSIIIGPIKSGSPPSPVEPSSFVLMALGLLGSARILARRKACVS